MTSALKNIHVKGLYGDFENQNEKNLLKISEPESFLIVQIFQYKNSSILINDIKIDNLNLKNENLKVSNNKETRILWNGPNNWILVSTKKELLKELIEKFDEANFAITNLSHSRVIIDIEGKNAKEVLKKGCPYNFDLLEKNNCLNSTYNGMTVTIDMLNDDPCKIRIFSLRSFGESLHHSITDSSLEFGYIGV